MPIARTRLFDELTVQRLVEELAATWSDDEAHVLAYLAELLETDTRQRGDEGIAFYYRQSLGAENEDGRDRYHPLKIPLVGGTHGVIRILRLTAQLDDWRIEDKKFRAIEDEAQLRKLSRAQGIDAPLPVIPPAKHVLNVSLSEIYVNKADMACLLSANNIPIPKGWGTALTEEGAQEEHRPRNAEELKLKTKAEKDCFEFLKKIGQDEKPSSMNTKDRLFQKAQKRFGVSRRAFDAIWRHSMPEKFKAPGARETGS